MSPSLWQILVVLAIVLILFGGRGKISGVMGDVAKGIKSFKTNIKDDEQSTDKIEKNEQSPVAETEPAAASAAREEETAKS